MSIGTNIKKRRYELRMSQQDLATACGLKSRSSINKIEKNTYEPSLEQIKKIAKALNTDADYLVFGNRDTKQEEIERLFGRLNEQQQEAVLAFLRTLTEDR